MLYSQRGTRAYIHSKINTYIRVRDPKRSSLVSVCSYISIIRIVCVCVYVCVQQVNLHASALCNAAANGRRICIYILYYVLRKTRYDNNVGRTAANGNYL